MKEDELSRKADELEAKNEKLEKELQAAQAGLVTNTIVSVCFLYKIIYLLRGPINDPSSRSTLISFVPPSNSLVSISNS